MTLNMQHEEKHKDQNEDQENFISPGSAAFLIVLGLGIATVAVILILNEEYISGPIALGLGLYVAITGAIPYTYRKKKR